MQELTEKIYSEGVEKANQEAEEIKKNAKKEADEMIKNAKKESARIIEKAEQESAEMKKNVESEIELSSKQVISAIKQKIASLITAKAVEEPVEKAFSDEEFIKKIIETLVNNWEPGKDASIDLSVILPEKQEKEMKEYFEKKQKKLLNAGLELKFDDTIDAGLKIGPKDGSYQISFTDKDFENLFKAYLRPRTIELLYGGK